jgi:outer membrane receptor protein involved in Fe transport
MKTTTCLASSVAIAVAIIQPVFAQDASPSAEIGDSSAGGEIVVTAQKREETITNVPASVTVLSAKNLIDRGATTLQDIAGLVPGLAIQPGDGGTQVVIRGINTNADSSATSGIIVDGTPIGSSSSFLQGGSSAFDMNPADLQRVEVLKGPQGTLYGASTLGGLISYVSRAPNLTDFSMLTGGEVSTTEHGKASYTVRGAINIPLIQDKLALRVSGFEEFRGGYIDNQLRGQRNINDFERYGGRVALRFDPGSKLSFTLSAVYQKTDRDAFDFIVVDGAGNPRDGIFRYDEINPSSLKQKYLQIHGQAKLDLGFADLTYIGSYQDIKTDNSSNGSSASVADTLRSLNFLLPLFGLPANAPAFPSPNGVRADYGLSLKKNSHELRLSSPGDGPLQYTIGGFFTYESAFQSQNIVGTDGVGIPVATLDPVLLLTLDSSFKEYAGFANVTYDLTPRLQIGGGLRIGRNEQRYSQGSAGSSLVPLNALLSAIYGPAATFPIQSTPSGSEESIKVYTATAKYSFSDNLNVYARFATGYRPGGPNTISPGALPTFRHDDVKTYEVGVKGRTADGRLRAEVAAFYVDWSDIQVVRSVNGISTRDNGGKASSRGFEASFTLLPTHGLSVSGSVGYTKARLDDDVPEIGAVAGDSLPTTPKWTASLTGSYEWGLSETLRGFVDGSLRMASDINTSFPGSASVPNIRLDGYAMADARAGVRMDQFEIAVFVRNLTDSRALLGGRSNLGLSEAVLARPRTIGVSWTANF